MNQREEMLDALAEIVKEARYLLYDETNWKLCKTSVKNRRMIFVEKFYSNYGKFSKIFNQNFYFH